MKLAIIIVLATTLQVQAFPTMGQYVNLNLKQTEVKKVLKLIENDGYYRFLYNSDLKGLKNKVDFSARDLSVIESLNSLFAGTNLTYKVLDNNLIVVLSVNAADNDKIKITGRVTGENGEALAGASVLEKGTNAGTYADNNGNFTITVESNATLVISSIGFEPQQVKVSGRSVVDVKLVPTYKKSDEVVVIGYGTASKRDLTGSIVKVSGKDIADKPNTNPIASLQGKVAGLSIVNNGTPGGSPDIRIRGTVSIGQVHPLYIVDGIFQDNIDYLNSNDIESIEVLKDASSLAIFGVKGATGVIAITTKRAKAGQLVINFNTSYGFKKLVDKIKMANSDQFNTLFAQENLNNSVTNPPNYAALTANTDWVDAVTRVGKFNTNNLSISSATDKNRFSLGLGYISDEGIIIHEKLEKMLLSFSDELKVSKNIKFGINLNASRQNNPYNAGSVLDNARKVMPQISANAKSFRVANPYGGDSINANIYSGLNTAMQTSGVVNPVLEVENTWNKNINIEYRTVASIYADINFTKNLNLRSTFYADMSNVNNRTYSPLYYAYNPMTNVPYLYGSKTQVQENDNSYKKFQQDHILTYRKNFGEHGLTAMAGFTTYYSGFFNRQGISKPYTTGNALPIPNDKRFWYIGNGFQEDATSLSSSSQAEYSTVSALARILYNYKGKYLLNASLRDDASSAIQNSNRHQKFWAVGGAWELSKEKFMEKVKYINYLKLKGSIGVLGNQAAPNTGGSSNYYPFYPNLQGGSSAVFGTYIYNAARDAYKVSQDLKWETVHSSEVGVELYGFNNRLHFEANYFNRVTKDLLNYIGLAQLGLDNEVTNGGSFKNWGEEFSASWNQNLKKDLSISVSGNITFLKNKVISLAKDIPGGYISNAFMNNGSAESRSIVGQPIGSFYGYTVEGLYQSYADILGSPVASAIGAYRPGDFKFKDMNGDGKITADDRTVIGNPTPKFTYGTNVTVKYKDISVSVDMGGVYGNQVFRTWGSLESPFQRVNYPAFKTNSWTGAGTSNWDPLVSQGDRFNYNGSTYNMEDGSYFRIRNVQLAYDFQSRLIAKAKMKSLKVYFNIQNAKTWKNNLGYTPEYGGSATAFGFDFGGGAIPMITTLGLNVNF